MTKKKVIALSVFLLIAGLIYFNLYKDSIGSNAIQIFHRVAATRTRSRSRSRQPEAPSATVLFGFNKKLGLTEIKVVPLSDLQTNKYPHPVWHLISDSNSIPVKAFTYGERISGMRPSTEGIQAEPLESNVEYRLIVDAGSLHAEHNFNISGQPAR